MQAGRKGIVALPPPTPRGQAAVLTAASRLTQTACRLTQLLPLSFGNSNAWSMGSVLYPVSVVGGSYRHEIIGVQNL